MDVSTEESLKYLISGSQVDFGKQSADYGTFRPGFPDSFFERVNGFVPIRGSRILDVGTGPGTVALELAKKGAQLVVGVDISLEQIEQAKLKAKELNLDTNCSFQVATAEETKQSDESFELVTAGQCWPWFDHKKAMKEIQRVLKPGGVLVIGQYCYLPKRSEVAKLTEDLILEYNPTWTMANADGLYPKQVDQLVVEGGFDFVEQFSYDHPQPFTHESWRGRIRTCNGVGSGVLTPEKVKQFDNDLKALMQKRYGNVKQFHVWHRVWGLVVRKPKITPKLIL